MKINSALIPIKTVPAAKTFITEVLAILGDGFHPDTAFGDYKVIGQDVWTFDRGESLHLDARMTEVFDLFGDQELMYSVLLPEADHEEGPDVWDFVEKYYPDYSSSEKIAYASDLYSVLEGTEIAKGSEILEKFKQDRDSIIEEHTRVQCDIYYGAIEGYLSQNQIKEA